MLQQVNRSAVRPLQGGLRKALTLHRLGAFEEVGRSLQTTNAIENPNSLVEKYIGNVKRWHRSERLPPARGRLNALHAPRPARPLPRHAVDEHEA